MAHIDTAYFITQVSAVVLAVTLAAAVDTGAITALELIGAAGEAATVGLVRAIQAVEPSITFPAAVDTLPAATLELPKGAGLGGTLRGSRPTVLGPLVGAIRAVSVPVAGPQARHTHRVVALEGGGATGAGWAGSLVAPVITVQLLITHKRG